MTAEELRREISGVIFDVMKNRNVLEYNDGYLHEEIRVKIMPFINQFKKEVLVDFTKYLKFHHPYSFIQAIKEDWIDEFLTEPE